MSEQGTLFGGEVAPRRSLMPKPARKASKEKVGVKLTPKPRALTDEEKAAIIARPFDPHSRR